MTWQPIETAPKDGTRVLLFWPSYAYNLDEDGTPLIDLGWHTHSYRVESAHASRENLDLLQDHWTNTDERDCYGLMRPSNQPTHWMPLPEPPA